MIDSPNLEIMEFVENNILPRYNSFAASYGISHVQRVINNALDLCKVTGADVNMVYVAAAYHDLGMEGHRAIHHLISGKILSADARLKRWFSSEQIRIMKEAVEDHRASSSRTPRNLYGKIIAEADRELAPDIVFKRVLEYGLEHYPEKGREEQWNRFNEHIQNKYGITGYIRLWIPNSPNAEKLNEIRKIIETHGKLKNIFDKLYDQLT